MCVTTKYRLRLIGIVGRPMQHKCPTNITKCRLTATNSSFIYLTPLLLLLSSFLAFCLLPLAACSHLSSLLHHSSPFSLPPILMINIRWVNHYNSIVASYQPSDVLFVRYEDLRNEATRVDTMRTVTDFLKVTIVLLLNYIMKQYYSLLILTLFVVVLCFLLISWIGNNTLLLLIGT